MKADTLATSIEEAGPLGPLAARDSGKVSRDLAPAGLHGLLPAIADIGLLRCRGCDAQSPTIACSIQVYQLLQMDPRDALPQAHRAVYKSRRLM